MKRLVTSTALVGTSSLVGVVVAVLRNKLLAVFVGAAGVGLLAQVGNLVNILSSLASLGVGVGVAKYAAEFSSRQDRDALARLKTSGLVPTYAASAVALVAALVLRKQLAVLIFGSDELSWAVALAALAVPLLVQFSFHLAAIQGLKSMRRYALANAGAAAAGLIMLVPLVYFLRWKGAVIHIVAAAALGYLVIRLVSRSLYARAGFYGSAGVDRSLVRELLAYGVGSLAVGALYWVNLLAVRSIIVRTLGPDANGIYQVALGISFQYLMLILNSVSAYAFPRLSELRERDSIVNEMRSAIRLSVLLVTACASVMLVARHWLVPLLFSSEFVQGERLLPAQFVADFLRAVAWMLGIWMLPQGRLRTWVGLDVVMNASLMAVFLALLSGARGFANPATLLLAGPIAHCVAYLIHCVLNYGYARRTIGFSFGGPLRRLLATSFGLVCVCGLIPADRLEFLLPGLVLMGLWARFSVSREEARAALSVAGEKLALLKRFREAE
ncbi:MAG: oligosaccharide flippase family protein [Candidatus Eisenbacteria bacterium]|nr:oligosaccharide flippase family protein [Candidatus Eisenbacteria bacterium]